MAIDFNELHRRAEQFANLEVTAFIQVLASKGEPLPSSSHVAVYVKLLTSVFRHMLEEYHHQTQPDSSAH